MNQFITMFTRMISRRLMRWGITKGAHHLSKARAGGAGLTPKQAKAARQATKRARQAAKLTRRINR